MKAKEKALSYLKEITDTLNNLGDNPLSGESRRTLLDKFSDLDRTLTDQFDKASFAYFEALENQED